MEKSGNLEMQGNFLPCLMMVMSLLFAWNFPRALDKVASKLSGKLTPRGTFSCFFQKSVFYPCIEMWAEKSHFSRFFHGECQVPSRRDVFVPDRSNFTTLTPHFDLWRIPSSKFLSRNTIRYKPYRRSELETAGLIPAAKTRRKEPDKAAVRYRKYTSFLFSVFLFLLFFVCN